MLVAGGVFSGWALPGSIIGRRVSVPSIRVSRSPDCVHLEPIVSEVAGFVRNVGGRRIGRGAPIQFGQSEMGVSDDAELMGGDR